MLWRDVMNPRLTDTVSVSALPADGNTLDLDLDAIPREDTLVRVVDGAGKCVGGVKRELLEYLRGTQLPERFMAILDKIDEAVIAIDREGRIYYVNPSYTKVLGVPVGRVLGRYLQRLEPSSALLTVLKPPHRPVSEKKQLIRSINKYVSIRVYPIFLHGRFQGAMSIFTDITRLNELNQEVERISQVAEEYSRQLEAETVLKQSQVIGESKVYTNSILKAVTVAKTDAAVDREHALAGELRAVQEELTHTAALMGAVVQYAKTRPVFDGYKAARYSKNYLAEHEAELASYRAAKAAMNDILAGAKLPKMDALKKSRRELAEKKKALYAEYRKAQQDMREAVAIKANIDHLLGVTGGRENKAQER